MGNVLVRDVDEGAIEVLRRRAEAEGRSLNAELRRVIEQAARAADAGAARELAEAIRVRLSGREHVSNAELVREMRDQ
ncbi:MAG: Arc family DNA-binding protein [Isosphaeraceae bacterium]